MAINHPKAGPNSVPAYQLSGIPFVTGSTNGTETITGKQFDFPSVTRFITIVNHAGTNTKQVRVAFSSEGLSGTPATGQKNYFSIPGDQLAVTLPVRCKTVFITTTHGIEWSLCAGLTPIDASMFPVLTGSSGYAGIGGVAT